MSIQDTLDPLLDMTDFWFIQLQRLNLNLKNTFHTQAPEGEATSLVWTDNLLTLSRAAIAALGEQRFLKSESWFINLMTGKPQFLYIIPTNSGGFLLEYELEF